MRGIIKQIILGRASISALLPRRGAGVHKYTAGRVLVVAGSRGMTGAALLAAKAALRAGAGLVTLAVPAELADLVDAQNREILTLPLPGRGGTLAPAALEILGPRLRKFDCVLLGPGLSARRPALVLVRDLLQYINSYLPGLKVVLDADALRALPLLQRPGFRMRAILTPHAGELAGLLSSPVRYVKKNPYFAARRAAVRHRTVVVFKNADKTYIVRERGRYFLNCNGNPGMATAGSGDVLAGIIAGLWVSTPGLTTLRTAAVGPYIHGLAGGLAARKTSVDGLIASDILENVPAALKILKGE
ncbi:MAG: NAD(P)H-hydrate dehydratase [Candidatus Margulisbacteria bacterium]|jgi:NAD(P)H-hydrate epimerase|nr:NAD(P)H-hydrate dehydratase [Candidatus Margulisiibacteriota bacterium]